MSLDMKTRKKLKALGHSLNPVVTVAGNGLSNNVLEEVRRALNDHELIKVKFAVSDRDAKHALMNEMCELCQCELVQTIGHIALIYRENDDAKINLSNVRQWDN